jgi:hypothetical protein
VPATKSGANPLVVILVLEVAPLSPLFDRTTKGLLAVQVKSNGPTPLTGLALINGLIYPPFEASTVKLSGVILTA